MSAQPTPQDTVTNSVPLDEWVCVRMIVNGTSSSLMIEDLVAAAGDLTYRSLNTGAPMVIGGGYHLNSLPVENPFWERWIAFELQICRSPCWNEFKKARELFPGFLVKRRFDQIALR